MIDVVVIHAHYIIYKVYNILCENKMIPIKIHVVRTIHVSIGETINCVSTRIMVKSNVTENVSLNTGRMSTNFVKQCPN